MDPPALLEAISLLLEKSGHDEGHPAWLRQRAVELRSATNEQQRRVTLTQIKGIIAGMGSLSDIYLVPPPESGLSAADANRKLGDLMRQLDQQVLAALDT